jgi:hypothetical protein
MAERDKFKSSPLHDKEAIINLMDNLNPEQMNKLVDFLISISEKKEVLEPEDVKIAVICFDGNDFIKWKYNLKFYDKKVRYDYKNEIKIGNEIYYRIIKLTDTKSKMFHKIIYTDNAKKYNKDFSEIQTLLTLNLK